jgi:hypothetical protein
MSPETHGNALCAVCFKYVMSMPSKQWQTVPFALTQDARKDALDIHTDQRREATSSSQCVAVVA